MQAIEDCLREPVTGQKRSVLADLIIIQDYLFGQQPEEQHYEPLPMASYDPPPERAEEIIYTEGGSEFLDAVNGKKPKRLWALMNELVESVKILHPRMYNTFIDKIHDL